MKDENNLYPDDPFLNEERAEVERERKEYEDYEPVEEKIVPVIDEFVYAGFWIRLVAFLIDAIVGAALGSIIGTFFYALSPTVAHVVEAIIFYLYFAISTKLTDGQTIGKMITGIRVISADESPLNWTTVLIREIPCRFIQTSFLILYLIPAFLPKKESVGDFFSDTYVVKDGLYQWNKSLMGDVRHSHLVKYTV